ncbi:MAG: response regulator [Bacteroidetes bacterium]|nr:MAG: response regulator [Bacteroidota bacterium]
MSLLDLILGKKTDNSKSESIVNKKKLKLFIVDDNEAFARLTENHLLHRDKLSKFDFEILKYNNGEECIQNLFLNPDLILLDYYMGDGTIKEQNGDEIFKRIVEINPNQKVVMLSGLEESAMVKNLTKMGLRDYIIKDEEMFENLRKVITEMYQ